MDTCPEENTAEIDQSSFWDNGINLDYHRIGWLISGVCGIITVIITIFSVMGHARCSSSSALCMRRLTISLDITMFDLNNVKCKFFALWVSKRLILC
ncbi:hypothetical protein M408DRAFT_285867 [Serendipita vermifera MAFF 305830]|uniref:Uncharacterized protein n=1 Tax=Serendipita vermifera MAFF 305830 TaxID=933852 RepID=A0A0C2WWE2_SERVB|nr:hypothetical protein M408DRAFT_285867 [Serendipita vermifera MAFF 305830]